MVAIEIVPDESGCTLALMQTGVAPNIVEESWIKMLEQLKLMLENQ
jgi:hypothetical protein